MADDPKTAAAPANAVRPMTPNEIRLAEQAERNRIQAEVEERDAMNGPEGGRYKVGDQFVNASGEPVK